MDRFGPRALLPDDIPTVSISTDPLKADFRNFLYVVWDHLSLPDPTPVQYDLAHFMQHGPRRKMIMAFRGVGKSWIYAAFVCWRLYCNPEWKIMVVSASKQLADDFSKFVKRLIEEMPILQHLKPRQGQRDSNISFDVGPASASKDPSVKSVGITGQITGSRADEILADDIESLNNSATQTARETLGEVVKEFDAVIKPKTGIITYLGTPQSENSMYAILPERGYQIQVWTARVPERIVQYKGFLSPYILDMIEQGIAPGTPVDPLRFDDQDLMEREASYGRSGFALQFMLDTSLSDANRYPLKLSDLIVMDLDPRQGPTNVVWTNGPEQVLEMPAVGLAGDRYYRPMRIAEDFTEFDGTVMAIDPSGRGKDETSYAVVRYLKGWLFLVASGGFHDGYSDITLEGLAKVAKEYGAQRIIIESNFGDGMFMKLLQPWMMKVASNASIEEVRSSVQKERRIIDVLEPVMNQHKLIVDKKVIDRDNDLIDGDISSNSQKLRYSLFYQMARLTREKGALLQDDRLDALHMAVAHWVELMARDADLEEAAHKNELLEKELEKFMSEVGVNDPRLEASNWMSV